MNLNVRAGFALCRAVIPDMVGKGWGRIILIGSSSSYIGTKGGSAYCASKHALLGLGRSLYHELREDNVRVHVVSPGTVATDMGAQLAEQDATTFIQPEEIAEMVLFLVKTEGNGIAEEVRVNRMIYR